MGRQEETCWRCGARVRRASSARGRGRPIGTPGRRPDHSDAFSRRARRRRADRRAAHRATPEPEPVELPAHGTTPSRAEDHARRQCERAEARLDAKRLTRELAVAIDAGNAGYGRLRHRLDDYSTRLEAVRSRLYR
jgi:hypothetical protein